MRVVVFVFAEDDEDRVKADLKEFVQPRHPDVPIDVEVSVEFRRGYCEELRYHIHADNDEEEFFTVDGGMTPWA